MHSTAVVDRIPAASLAEEEEEEHELNLGGVLTAAALLTVAAVAMASRKTIAPASRRSTPSTKRRSSVTMRRPWAGSSPTISCWYSATARHTRARASRIRTLRQDRLRAPGRGRRHADRPGLGRHGSRRRGSGSRVSMRVWPSSGASGSATRTFARRPAGAMHSDRPRCPCLRRRHPQKRNRALSETKVAPSCIDRSRRIAGTHALARILLLAVHCVAMPVAYADKALNDRDAI